MKRFLYFLVILGVIGGGIYYYNPDLFGREKITVIRKKITRKTAKQDAPKADAWLAEDAPAATPEAAAAQAEQADPDDAQPQEPISVEEMVKTKARETMQLFTSGEEQPKARRASRPLEFPDHQAARAKAREAGRPSLILWYGSDWMPYSARLVSQWTKLGKSGLPVVFGQINETVGSLQNNRNAVLPTGQFNALPVAVLMAPDETLLGIYSGQMLYSAAAMEKAVESVLKTMPEYMKLVEKARSAPGVEGATAAARALAMLPHSTMQRNHQLKDIIRKKDPKFQTVFRYLYCMDHIGMFQELNALLAGGKGPAGVLKGADRKFDDAMALVQKVLAAPGLSTELQQQWNAAKAYVLRERYKSTNKPQLRQQMVDCYKYIAQIDPESEYGKGAARLARHWDDSVPYVFNEPYYDSGDMTAGFEKAWHVDVSSQVDKPGKYTFSLVPLPGRNGRMSTREFQLFANGKHVCDADEPADKDTRSVTFQVPRTLRGKVEVRFRAQCFDGWYNCAGEMVMKRER